jgi:hypothetical protein
MSVISGIVNELRENRRLAIVAAVLATALVAVPVLLSKGAKSTPVAQAPATNQPAAPSGVPVVSSGSAPASGKLGGSSRDPFTQLAHGAAAGVTSALGGPVTSGTTGTSSGSSGGPTSSNGTPVSGPSTGISPTTIPTGTPTRAPAGLAPTQSYEVKLAITNSAGGLNTIDPLERLSVLPRSQQPLLVELGVLKGGNRVLFAVAPGAVVSGPGTCIPGPIDCEVLSLAQDKVEQLSAQTASGDQAVALFAVTGIAAAGHSSVAAANQARQAASGAGRRLLADSSSSALSLFRYEPSLGVVVDLRNLVIGG